MPSLERWQRHHKLVCAADHIVNVGNSGVSYEVTRLNGYGLDLCYFFFDCSQSAFGVAFNSLLVRGVDLDLHYAVAV